jgi:phospholipid/cholesterol/gamma-HCH transport system substrate-binding protein
VKRLATIGGLCAAAVAFLVAGPAAPSGRAGDSLEVDALFHNASGLVGGEDMKVAGVPAGTVKSVELTDGRLALVRMEVAAPFAPFRADARCEVRSQSLIGERFIQCDPGTPAAGSLPTPDGADSPTVPADQDSAPIDLDLLFDVFRQPYRQRLAIVLNELGAGLTGRGEDLNAIIRSANPALANARRVLADLNGQRAELQQGIDQTDRVLASVAARPASVDRFIGKLAGVSERFGRHQAALGESVARLPGLLAQAEPALRELDGLSVEALPVLHNLRLSAPGARELAGQLGPLSRSARPTLARLGGSAVRGRTALERSMPFLDSLRRTLVELRPISPTARALLESLVERGGTEGLLRFFYNAGLATSRYDGTSHVFPAHLVAGLCGLYRSNEPPVEGCHGRFTTTATPAAGLGAHLKKGTSGTAPAPSVTPLPGVPSAPAGAGDDDSAKPPKLPSLPSLPSLPNLPNLTPTAPGNGDQGSDAVNDLLDFLLGR